MDFVSTLSQCLEAIALSENTFLLKNTKPLDNKGLRYLCQAARVLAPSLELLKDYKIIVLGDREFCPKGYRFAYGVELARWLSQQEKVYLSLRLKKNEYVELEAQIWFQLSDLGLEPGMSCYYQGIRVTKTRCNSRIDSFFDCQK